MFDELQIDGPPLAVVIATAGRPALLDRTLASLISCEKPAHFQGVWVVENGPPGTVRQIVAKYDARHAIRYVHVPRPNKSHALNTLLAQTNDELLFFTDDDVRFDNELFCAYATAAQGVVRGRFFGGPLGVDYEGSPPLDWMRPMLPKTVVGWRRPERQITRLGRPRFLGPNWAAFAEDLREIGGFDPRLGPGAATGSTGQETEAQSRLSAAGVDGYYVPQAMAWHFASSESLKPEWIIERKRRHSREWGIMRARGYRSSLVAGYAQLRLQRALRRRWRCDSSDCDSQSRHKADYHVAKWQGRLEGLAIGSNWSPLPQIHQHATEQRAA